jgi:hypothetical protein
MDATNHSDHKALGTTISNIWFTEQKHLSSKFLRPRTGRDHLQENRQHIKCKPNLSRTSPRQTPTEPALCASAHCQPAPRKICPSAGSSASLSHDRQCTPPPPAPPSLALSVCSHPSTQQCLWGGQFLHVFCSHTFLFRSVTGTNHRLVSCTALAQVSNGSHKHLLSEAGISTTS